MLVDPLKMKSARDRRALTQEALAHQARINVRTVQRAEAGFAIQAETLAEIAAVLGLPSSGLVRPNPAGTGDVVEAESDDRQTQILKRVESIEAVVGTLERSLMGVLGCHVEPTAENMPALRKIITNLEGLIRNPWDDSNFPPLRFDSLLGRLETVAALSQALVDIERQGLGLYLGVSIEYVKRPRYSDEGMVTHVGQTPEYVRAARFQIAEYTADRIRLPRDTIWPVDIEPDDIPF